MTETQENKKYEFVDRYAALGILQPDPATMCKGFCEGTGWYPLYLGEFDLRDKRHRTGPVEQTATLIEDVRCSPEEREKYLVAHNHAEAHKDEPCDGWHFVQCPDCHGSGKAEI